MKNKIKKTKDIKKKHRLLKAVLSVIGAAVAAVAIINIAVIASTSRYILTPEEAAQTKAECVMVLGCSVRPDGSLSAMLEDRVLTGIELFQNGSTQKLLMSGDHGQADYDEVNKMKDYAALKGVPADSILLDHAGFSTYESMFRAVKIFQVKKLIISTQGFHLNRAVYDARRLGIDAYGVRADKRGYATIFNSRLREIAARCKDFVWCVFKPEPTYLGDAIPINSSIGSDTDDREPSTNLEPFVPPITEYVSGAEVSAPEKQTEPPSISEMPPQWPDNPIMDGIPKIKADKLTVRQFVFKSGKQIIIRAENFNYNEYLKYLGRLEDAGFTDKNSRANVPKNAPATVAMFYSSFDGKRALIANWNGSASSASFDFEISIYNFDPTK